MASEKNHCQGFCQNRTTSIMGWSYPWHYAITVIVKLIVLIRVNKECHCIHLLSLLRTLGSGVPMMSWILAIWSTSLEPGNSGCKLHVHTKQVSRFLQGFAQSVSMLWDNPHRDPLTSSIHHHSVPPYGEHNVLSFHSFYIYFIPFTFT